MARVFAPATVANVGPGFDIFGFAIEGMGDVVAARKTVGPGVFIKKITGDGGQLPYEPHKNTASIAALGFLERLGIQDAGIELELEKGMPINSGLGSSGASAVAGAFAALKLFAPEKEKDFALPACVKAEAAVAGFHADNVAASLFGGIVIVKSYEPLEVLKLPAPDGLFAAVVSPEYEVSTKDARHALPQNVPLKSLVRNTGNVASLVAGVFRNDIGLIGRSVEDCIVEPVRGKLIPGFDAVKKAALDSGALGCSISGSGPSVFAFAGSLRGGRSIAKEMTEAFANSGLASKSHVSKVNGIGAKDIS